ncbi:ABC transporter permease [Sphingomonas corticis]|jgi:ABC-type transporter Mla maintaining outer membrane lipid asymmetry permease subunit MlaE|nr:ABC transporter permease [Sphingomonas corticis]
MMAVLRGAGSGAWLVARAARGTWTRWNTGDALLAPALARDLARFLWTPVPTVVALSLLTGVIAGLSAARVLALYHAELLVLRALVDALLRQVLPLVVGIFAASGVAVAVANRLGAMSLQREIDALETMGHDPVPFALGTPVIAVAAAVPVHMVLASVAALLGAGLLLAAGANVPWRMIVGIATAQPAVAALATGMAKVALFSLLALMAGAATGARRVATPAELSAAGARAFTRGLLCVFGAAAMWTALA